MEIISRKKAKEQGLKHYFTGKPCPNGHIAQRFVSSFGCTVCAKAHYDERRKKHPEKYAEASRKHYQNNREKCIQSVMESQKKHRERHLKNKRDYHHRHKDRLNENRSEWYRANRDLAYLRQREYVKNNAEKVAEYQKRYRQENKDRLRENRRDWAQRNGDRISALHKWKIKNDPSYKSARAIRQTLHRVLSLTGREKMGRTEKVLGYSVAEFRAHMERNMLPDMNWSNHGTLWHIDHVIPVADFVRVGVTDPAKVNALENLMPVYAKDNLSKGARFALSPQPVL